MVATVVTASGPTCLSGLPGCSLPCHRGRRSRWASGDYVSGPRVINADVKATMKSSLTDLQDGAARFIADQAAGAAEFNRLSTKGEQHPIEATGAKLGGLMIWVAGRPRLHRGHRHSLRTVVRTRRGARFRRAAMTSSP